MGSGVFLFLDRMRPPQPLFFRVVLAERLDHVYDQGCSRILFVGKIAHHRDAVAVFEFILIDRLYGGA